QKINPSKVFEFSFCRRQNENRYRTNLIESSLYDANRCKTKLNGADLNRVKLYRAKLIGTNFSGTVLGEVDLDEANLLGIIWT
ncbi:MAG: pentapeptide repeat-containing protein, partial [Pseudanabaena sp.]